MQPWVPPRAHPTTKHACAAGAARREARDHGLKHVGLPSRLAVFREVDPAGGASSSSAEPRASSSSGSGEDAQQPGAKRCWWRQHRALNGAAPRHHHSVGGPQSAQHTPLAARLATCVWPQGGQSRTRPAAPCWRSATPRRWRAPRLPCPCAPCSCLTRGPPAPLPGPGSGCRCPASAAARPSAPSCSSTPATCGRTCGPWRQPSSPCRARCRPARCPRLRRGGRKRHRPTRPEGSCWRRCWAGGRCWRWPLTTWRCGVGLLR